MGQGKSTKKLCRSRPTSQKGDALWKFVHSQNWAVYLEPGPRIKRGARAMEIRAFSGLGNLCRIKPMSEKGGAHYANSYILEVGSSILNQAHTWEIY